ncbi:Karyopherin transporter [Allomyces javanicus]|nr:Karyopherin transporter [Allomyces javanicus]
MADFNAVLDFSAPLNVDLLDRVVTTFYAGRGQEQAAAQRILTEFQNHPEAWTRADVMLETSKTMQTKYLALQVLERLIQTRWKILQQEQRDGIKGYIVNRVIQLSSVDVLPKNDRAFLAKLNLVLVQILKQDWPHAWPNFISEIVAASRSSVPLCENNMAILKLLSEEIFDFSAEQMTQTKARTLKTQMCGEFAEVFNLCSEVLEQATKESLLHATLATLLRFLNWIPLGYIFQTNIIDLLAKKFLAVPVFQNAALQCLTEIAALDVSGHPEYQSALSGLFLSAMQTIVTSIPQTTDFAGLWDTATDQQQELVQNLALFLTTYLAKHGRLAEAASLDASTMAHRYLLRIARVDEREIFKVCLEYFNKLLADLYEEMQTAPGGGAAAGAGLSPSGSVSMLPNAHPAIGLLNLGGAATAAGANLRKDKYPEVLSEMRLVFIESMVKPEEVLVVENEDGAIVRESMKEVDTIVLYKSMREGLVYLTHLDPHDTERIMVAKLQRQIDGSEWSWANLNRLCWAVGSISGAMVEDHEKNFLVHVIKELLGLVDMKRGKDNKAVVASNIMYVVGQYPRFLKAHWRFLKTVVKKLFEFMHELHEGVQDMACDTFIKIAQKTRRHFVIQQPHENAPFIDDILLHLPEHTSDLQPQQVHVFFEAVGYLVSAQPNKQVQEKLVGDLMRCPNIAWDQTMQAAMQGVPVLENPESVKALVNILRTNTAACTSIGPRFKPQIERIYMDMLGLYRAASGAIHTSLQADPTTGFARPLVRGLRSIKKETLRLVETYVSKADELEDLAKEMVPLLLDACLGDYAANPPQTRDAEVLNVVAEIVSKLGRWMNAQVDPILKAVFSCTLEMINKELVEYPEHRTGFFKLLRALVGHCFTAILQLPPEMFTQVINSIVWGFKHTMRDIADTALGIVGDLLQNMATKADQTVANQFYQAYYLQLLQDLFFVLTDSEHKSGFVMQVQVLALMMHAVSSGQVAVPLSGNPAIPNVPFLRDHLQAMMKAAFPHVSDKAVTVFAIGLLELNADPDKFRPHVRDFLIQLKEFAGQADDLYLAEREKELAEQRDAAHRAALAIPGMVKPSEQMDDDM